MALCLTVNYFVYLCIFIPMPATRHLVEGYHCNRQEIFLMRVGFALKFFKVRGQRSFFDICKWCYYNLYTYILERSISCTEVCEYCKRRDVDFCSVAAWLKQGSDRS